MTAGSADAFNSSIKCLISQRRGIDPVLMAKRTKSVSEQREKAFKEVAMFLKVFNLL